MAIKDLKFEQSEFSGKDISSLPDRPGDIGMTAEQLKARFDQIGKAMLALGRYNSLIDALGATGTGDSGADNIGAAAIADISGGTVQTALEGIKARADSLNAATQSFAAGQAAETRAYAEQQARGSKEYVDRVVLGAGAVTSVNGKAGAVELIPPDIGAASNPNLLDNWYFADPIDQRQGYVIKPNTPYYREPELTNQIDTTVKYYEADVVTGSYAQWTTTDGTIVYSPASAAVRGYMGSGYTIDRWWSYGNTITLDTKGIMLQGADATYNGTFRLAIENPKNFVGKQMTLSVFRDLAIGNSTCIISIVKSTGINSGLFQILRAEFLNESLCEITFTCPEDVGSSAYPMFLISITTPQREKNKIIAAKLELGDKQTLAHQDADGNWVLNDPPPNKALELAKCQRYLRRLKNNWDVVGIGVATATTTLILYSPIGNSLRAAPKISFRNLYVVGGDKYSTQSYQIPNNATITNGKEYISITGMTGLTTNETYIVMLRDDTGLFEMDANL